MHPAFLAARSGAANGSDYLRHRRDLAGAARAARCAPARLRRGRRLRAEGRPPPPAADGGRRPGRRPVRAREAPTTRTRICSAPGALPALLPAGRLPLRQRAARRAAWRRSPSRSAATASRATARPERQGRAARSCPQGVDGDELSAHRRRRLRSRAISSTRRRTTWARRSSRAPRARWPSATARSVHVDRRRRSARGELPADPRGRPRRRRARRG